MSINENEIVSETDSDGCFSYLFRTDEDLYTDLKARKLAIDRLMDEVKANDIAPCGLSLTCLQPTKDGHSGWFGVKTYPDEPTIHGRKATYKLMALKMHALVSYFHHKDLDETKDEFKVRKARIKVLLDRTKKDLAELKALSC